MAKRHISELEHQKFQIDDETIGTPVKVRVTGEIQPSGLQTAGKHTEVSIDDSSWTALPGTAQSGRNAIAIQNNTGYEIKVNYSPDIGSVAYVGMRIATGNERQYDITDDIIIYGRAESGAGTVVVDVEELS